MRLFFTIMLVALIPYVGMCGNPNKDIQNLFDPNYRNITFLGMDFTKTRFIGDFSEALGAGGDNNAQTKNAYLKAWNNLVSGEAEKYNLKKTFKNNFIKPDISNLMKLNFATKLDDFTAFKEPNYTDEEIKEHAKIYSSTENKGLGVVLLMECFNKNDVRAIIKLVVINLETKEVVLMKNVITQPGGFGLRNYWAGAIYEAFRTIEKKLHKEWKLEYDWQ